MAEPRRKVEPSRSWIGVINNYTDQDLMMLEQWKDIVTKMVVTRERGAEGTPHLQCAFTFRTNKRLSALKKLHSSCHWEVTQDLDADLYCLKLDSDVVFNVDNRKQGHRTDLEGVAKLIKEGASKHQIMNQMPNEYMKYHAGIDKMVDMQPKELVVRRDGWLVPMIPAEAFKKTILIWGPKGTGKTEYAKAQFKNPLLVSHIDDLKGLSRDNDGIVFDDVSFTHWPRTAAIHLCDMENPRSINVKYGTVTIPMGTKRIITSNEPWPFPVDDHGAIKRRVEIIPCPGRIFVPEVFVTEVAKGNTNFGHLLQTSQKPISTDDILAGMDYEGLTVDGDGCPA